THTAGNALMAMLRREETFEHLTERLQRLGRARWLAVVLARVGEVHVGLATARAIGPALGRLSRRTRVVGYLPQVSMRTLLITAELAEVVAPPSAEVMLPGFAAEQVYLGAFLAKHGIGFENLRIREYKTALSQFSSDHMDSHEREQLSAYISSAERTWLQAVADGAEPAAVFDAALASAEDLLAAGLLTRVSYEDEIVTIVDPPWGRVIELVVPARKRRTSNAE